MQENNKIKTILIDDEQHALDTLDTLLNLYPDIQVLKKINEPEQAVEIISEQKPDLIFLDIQMPRIDGFQLLEAIEPLDTIPGIIFTTSYDEYAIKAIRYAAFDYLLKPIEINELGNAIKRFKNKGTKEKESQKNNPLKSRQNGKMKFKTRNGIIFISLKDILHFEADSNYTIINISKNNKKVVSINLGEIESEIPDSHFFRISRSVIINTRYLVKIEKKSQKCYLEKGNEQVVLKISQRRIKDLEALFG